MTHLCETNETLLYPSYTTACKHFATRKLRWLQVVLSGYTVADTALKTLLRPKWLEVGHKVVGSNSLTGSFRTLHNYSYGTGWLGWNSPICTNHPFKRYIGSSSHSSRVGWWRKSSIDFCQPVCPINCLLFYVVATSKVISVRIHGNFIVLPHWDTRPLAP